MQSENMQIESILRQLQQRAEAAQASRRQELQQQAQLLRGIGLGFESQPSDSNALDIAALLSQQRQGYSGIFSREAGHPSFSLLPSAQSLSLPSTQASSELSNRASLLSPHALMANAGIDSAGLRQARNSSSDREVLIEQMLRRSQRREEGSN
jgi:hypothetical protein